MDEQSNKQTEQGLNQSFWRNVVALIAIILPPCFIILLMFHVPRRNVDQAKAGTALRTVAQAVLTYHHSLDERDGFPQNSQSLVQALISKALITEDLLEDWPGSQGIEPIFYYIPAGIGGYDPEQVMLIENPAIENVDKGHEGCWFAYADSHVEWKRGEECAEYFKQLLEAGRLSPLPR